MFGGDRVDEGHGLMCRPHVLLDRGWGECGGRQDRAAALNPPRNLNAVLLPPRPPISMFSGARHAAGGPEEKSEVGGSGMNIEIWGSGALTHRGENCN